MSNAEIQIIIEEAYDGSIIDAISVRTDGSGNFASQIRVFQGLTTRDFENRYLEVQVKAFYECDEGIGAILVLL
jgi:hypothetical protein